MYRALAQESKKMMYIYNITIWKTKDFKRPFLVNVHDITALWKMIIFEYLWYLVGHLSLIQKKYLNLLPLYFKKKIRPT